MLDAIKKWADEMYPNNTHISQQQQQQQELTSATITKKSDSSVLIGKNSGWRGSAMMDQRYRQKSISDEGY